MNAGRPPRWCRPAAAFLVAVLASGACFASASDVQRRADFGAVPVSATARGFGDWVVGSNDNHGEPFVIVDKVDSRVYVFDARGAIRGASSALLGMAKGDGSVAGIGERKMSTIRPDERTTPAGRFAASVERSLHGDEILWVDYEAAIALHRVAAGVPRERRMQRLASSIPQDRRITYGCINVPVKFFDDVVLTVFAGAKGVVYVLPETRTMQEVFGIPPVEATTARASER